MPNETDKLAIFLDWHCSVTRSSLCAITKWIWWIVPFILLVVVLIGNFINILVLTRPQMRKQSTCVYLLFLAVSESSLLFSSVLRSSFRVTIDVDIQNLSAFNCVMHEWIAYTAGGYSVWLLVLLTGERTAVTRFPVAAKRHVSPRNATIAAVVTLASVAMTSGHLLFAFKMDDIVETDVNGSTSSQSRCTFRYPDSLYPQFYNSTWRVFILVGYQLIPSAIIISGNVMIAWTLRTQSRRVQPSANGTGSIVSEGVRSATKMLFVLSAFFILSTTPWCIFMVVIDSITETNVSEDTRVRLNFVYGVVKNLLHCNFAFNFFLYFISGSLFKKEWRLLVQKAKRSLQLQT